MKELYYEETVWHHKESNYYIRKDGEKYDVWLEGEWDENAIVAIFDTFERCHIFIEEMVVDET